jgi:sugar lactone lactonase YvrE
VNNRIQIFDQNGKFLEQWTQFGRPSNIFFDKKGMIYVTDNTDPRTSEWPKGIRIGSVEDGVVSAFIPDPDTEFITVDASGNIYAVAAMAVPNKRIKKYIKQ